MFKKRDPLSEDTLVYKFEPTPDRVIFIHAEDNHTGITDEVSSYFDELVDIFERDGNILPTLCYSRTSGLERTDPGFFEAVHMHMRMTQDNGWGIAKRQPWFVWIFNPEKLEQECPGIMARFRESPEEASRTSSIYQTALFESIRTGIPKTVPPITYQERRSTAIH